MKSLTPRLLVSVRNAEEAAAAIAGGCDVLDVKDPARGSLGMADAGTIAAICRQRTLLGSSLPVSIALGDADEWDPSRPAPRLPPDIAYLKLGTARLMHAADPQAAFQQVQRCLSTTAPRTNSPPAEWIAVAYADHELARAPHPEHVAELARACGCTGLLIDTCTKQDKRLLDWLTPRQLTHLGRRCRTLGLMFAVAGRVQSCDLPALLLAAPDTIGIRSAACRGGNRGAPIDADALREFSLELQAAARQSAPASQVCTTGD